ncbi:hypothetical protein QN277_027840 [Acacia crassicarpa]|uniref:Disease resistance protein n=1 Tax=Acacia crassicarpa TaxID=499986 RepID=A0AAE1J5B7_9FABA|nr:hypothetical protein QN277_027840 [Acacia crassicarpa]
MVEGAKLMEGADLVVSFQKLLKKINEMIEKAHKKRSRLQIFRLILKDSTSLVEDIKNLNDHLDRPRKEIEKLIQEKEAGDELVGKSRKICLWEFLGIYLPFNSRGEKNEMARDVKETLEKVREILKTMSKDNSEHKITCLPPQNTEIVIGMEEPLLRLKMEVLKDGASTLKDGASTLELTGLPGSGKTTLARKLCSDGQVKGKFRDHILFVTFSKTPNFKVIVQSLFQPYGKVPEFHNDEEAAKELGLLLSKISGSPILLVLDDVWPSSESLIQNFIFQIPDYKILVTSRVTFPAIKSQIHLKPLRYEDALTLFRHVALAKDNGADILSESLVEEVVRSCKGLPLAIKVIARSLCQQPREAWQKMVKAWLQGHSILDSNSNLLNFLQGSLSVLEGEPIIMECFKDLGLFPEDQRIPATALIDMWAELYKLDDDGKEAMNIINKLVSLNLANLLVTRKVESDIFSNYSNHFIMQHDLLRELAIYQSNQEPFERRRRLMVDINENNPQWLLEEQQPGIAARMLPIFFKWCFKQKQQPAIARTLSISTDEVFTSDWGNTQLSEIEALILNVRTKHYSLLKSIEKMRNLKVLICTNYGFHPARLENFELLDSLSNLKRIRMEKIFLPSLGKLKNLQKLSLYMCDTSEAFGNCKIPISDALPILVELNIDYCRDMVELPSSLCDIKTLRKLSISNCHKFTKLPQEIGRLENLELLKLNSCTDLGGIPESVGCLSRLHFLDISNCISLRDLPESIGNLKAMEKLYMTGCSRCELPNSVINLKHLKSVTCDEETAASWEVFKPMLINLKIEVPHVEVNLNWLLGD